MKATELRIGNLIKWDDESSDIVSVTYINVDLRGECAIGTDKNELAEIGEFTPIQLTKEWLVKFGFETIGNNYQKEWLLLHSNMKTDTIDFLLNEPYSGKMKVTILESVHQLQNLYFTLTGEELTVNNL